MISQMLHPLRVCFILYLKPVNERCFTDVKTWMRQIEQHASPDVNKILIGNKADADDKSRVRITLCLLNSGLQPELQVVSAEEGRELAEQFGIKFYETSAKTGQDVDTAFLDLSKEVTERLLNEGNGRGGGDKVVVDGAKPERAGCCK
jgi:Ras-related protein Rab-8A